MNLSILSGGAAFGLVDGIRDKFRQLHAGDITGEFGAVGLMKEKFLSGQSCDAIILSRKLIDELAQGGHVDPTSIRDLGVVSTGIGAKAGQTLPPLDTQERFREALLAADEIMVPHLTQSTAGIHMKQVFNQLGVFVEIANRIKEFPNGATAMKALAATPKTKALGCTQVTEILYTPGVQVVSELPPGCELDTVYTIAVATASRQHPDAMKLVELLSHHDLNDFKNSTGFKVQ